MTPATLMRLMRLLSAIEGVMMAEGRRIPDYLHGELGDLVKELEREILGSRADA